MEFPLVERSGVLDRFARAIAGGDGASLLLVGAAGIGRSRLLRELLLAAEGQGLAVERAAASRAATQVPFGAFAHLLPDGADVTASDLQLVVTLRQAIRERSGGRNVVLGIDDVPSLDPASTFLVDHLLRTGAVAACIATARDGDALPDPFRELRKDGLLELVTLDPVSPSGVETLVAATLDGHVTEPVHNELWRLSEGNPMLLHELLAAGLEEGSLRRTGDVWHLAGPLTDSRRLADVVAHRLGTLAPDERHVMEILAVGGPLATSLLASDPDVLARLEVQGLLRLEQSGARSTVRLTHPLDGEVLRGAMPRSRVRRINGDLADRLIELGMERRDDALRVAIWLSDTDRRVPADLAEAAAIHALERNEPATAERLARKAVESGGPFAAHLALGEALSRQGRGVEAEAALAVANEHARGKPQEMVRCAAARVRNTGLVIGDPSSAQSLGRRLLSTIADAAAAAELVAELAFQASLLGDFQQAARLSGQLLTRTDLEDRVRLQCVVVHRTALVWLGRLDEAATDDDQAETLARKLAEAEPLASHWVRAVEVERLAYSGRLAEAEAAARQGYREAVQEGARPLLGPWAAELAIPLLFAGQLTAALAASEEALAHLRAGDPIGIQPLVASTAAVLAAQTGARRQGQRLLAEVDGDRRDHEVRTGVFAEWAEAWLTAASGDPENAAPAAAAAGARALDAQYVVWGCVMLHDAARIGRPDLVSEDLAAAAPAVDGELIPAMAEHTVALVDRDAERLADVAATFARLGAEVLAAEAVTDLALLHQDAGDQPAANRAATRGGLLRRLHPEATTPTLTRDRRVPAPLTAREMEVCALALSGAPSRAIAAQLQVSVRTVDNHLASIYRKLEVHGRQQLSSCVDAC